MKVVPAIVLALIAALAGCAKPTLESCQARLLRNGDTEAFNTCMLRYRVESGTATFEERLAWARYRTARKRRVMAAFGNAAARGTISQRPAPAPSYELQCWSDGYGHTNCRRY